MIEEEIFFFDESDTPVGGVTSNGALTLRYYQLDAHVAIKDWIENIGRKPLVVMATGTGKTPVIVSLEYKRALYLAHRDRLCEQLYSSVKWAKPHVRVGIEKAENTASLYDEVVVASIQTMGATRVDEEGLRETTNRLLKFPRDHFDLIVVDEAHHALGASYLRIFQHFRAGEKDGPVLLGVTATPFRGDGEPLSNVFDEHEGLTCFKYTIETATEEGWLCDLQYRRMKTDIDISGVPTRGDDLDMGALAEKINVDQRNSAIISAIEDYASGRNSILVFAADIGHAETLAAQLTARGIPADFIHYKLSKEQKSDTLDRFHRGDLRALVNVMILTEGVDLPRVDCMVFARPTRSIVLLSQMIGRGTRQICPKCFGTDFDVKRDELFLRWECRKCQNIWDRSTAKTCLILDFVDLAGQLDIRSAMDIFESQTVDLLGSPIREALPVLREANDFGIKIEEDDTIDDVRTRVRRVRELVDKTVYVETEAEAVDLFDSIRRVPVHEFSVFPWHKLGDQRYLFFGFNGARVGVWRNDLGEWWIGANGQGRQKIGVRSEPPWGKIDKQVKRYFNEPIPVSKDFSRPQWKFIESAAKWRSEPVKPTQVAALNRLGVKVIPPNINRGAASDMQSLIEHHRKKGKRG